MTPLLLLDIDDTIRKGKDTLGHFINGPDEVELFPEVLPLLKAFKASGWATAGVSNQGGIALGLVSYVDVQAGMTRTIELCEGYLDTIAFCPHHPGAAPGIGAIACNCRKPKVGLVQVVCKQLWTKDGGFPKPSLMVGDRDEDRGFAAGIPADFMEASAWRKTGLDWLSWWKKERKGR